MELLADDILRPKRKGIELLIQSLKIEAEISTDRIEFL